MPQGSVSPDPKTAFGSPINTIVTPTHELVARLVADGLITDDLVTRHRAFVCLEPKPGSMDSHCVDQDGHDDRVKTDGRDIPERIVTVLGYIESLTADVDPSHLIAKINKLARDAMP